MRVTVPGLDDLSKKVYILEEVEKEIELFSAFMVSIEDWRAQGALTNPEKALLRTFLIQKLQEKF